MQKYSSCDTIMVAGTISIHEMEALQDLMVGIEPPEVD